MSEKKLPNGMKLVFAPGSFDKFEGTQEELDQLIKDIEQGFSDGSFLEKATPVDLDNIDEMSDEELEALMKLINAVDTKTDRKLN
jgi:hypothetical protein